MRGLFATCLVAAAVLTGCQDATTTPDAARPGSLTIGVGGSVGMAGAGVSQPRTDAPRGGYTTRP
ncbi:hypothetical protein AAFN86_18010 [Roseomonas sp. CAU 1739]